MPATRSISDDARREIQLRAYLIWEREGRPQGREHAHWLMAEAEIMGDKPAKTATRAKPDGTSRTTKPMAANTSDTAAAKPAKAVEKAKGKKPKKAARPKSSKT